VRRGRGSAWPVPPAEIDFRRVWLASRFFGLPFDLCCLMRGAVGVFPRRNLRCARLRRRVPRARWRRLWVRPAAVARTEARWPARALFSRRAALVAHARSYWARPFRAPRAVVHGARGPFAPPYGPIALSLAGPARRLPLLLPGWSPMGSSSALDGFVASRPFFGAGGGRSCRRCRFVRPGQATGAIR